MATRIQITFDSWNVHLLSTWWARRLGYVVDDPHDRVKALLDAGTISGSDVITTNGRLAFASTASAHDPDGVGPRLYFQAVSERKTAKNRVHLDVSRGDLSLEDAVAACVEDGASFDRYVEKGRLRWAVMADPEGNEFCLF